MNTRNKNRILVTLFLVCVIGFTGLMTFVAGPEMMKLRTTVESREVLYKCQKVVDGDTIEVQLRSWRMDNPNPRILVRLAGLNAPPLGAPDHPEVRQWARKHGVSPELTAQMGESAHNTLLAFIRKQNLLVRRADGRPATEELPPGTPVHVFVSGSHVNLKQLRNGLALHDTTSPHAYREDYAAAEAKAREQRAGIWRD